MLYFTLNWFSFNDEIENFNYSSLLNNIYFRNFCYLSNQLDFDKGFWENSTVIWLLIFLQSPFSFKFLDLKSLYTFKALLATYVYISPSFIANL